MKLQGKKLVIMVCLVLALLSLVWATHMPSFDGALSGHNTVCGENCPDMGETPDNQCDEDCPDVGETPDNQCDEDCPDVGEAPDNQCDEDCPDVGFRPDHQLAFWPARPRL